MHILQHLLNYTKKSHNQSHIFAHSIENWLGTTAVRIPSSWPCHHWMHLHRCPSSWLALQICPSSAAVWVATYQHQQQQMFYGLFPDNQCEPVPETTKMF